MSLRPIASSSRANCYLLEPGLMIEAGLSIRDIRKAAGFNLASLAGCLVTHEHGDHARGVKDLLKASVDCYMSQGTADALCVAGHHRVHILTPLVKFQVGEWAVLPFSTVHDAAAPLGFLLARGDEKWLFVTDSAFIEPRFSGLTGIAIEANYCPEILRERVSCGAISPAMRDRLLFSHFSIDNVLEFLKANDISKVRQIVLLHLSDSNSNAEEFKKKVQAATGKPVMVAAA